LLIKLEMIRLEKETRWIWILFIVERTR